MKKFTPLIVLLALFWLAVVGVPTPALAQDWSECPEVDSRIAVGDTVTVSDANSLSLRLRRYPRLDAPIVDYIPVNTELEISAGPRCADGWGWWFVHYNGHRGWVGEVGPEGLFNLEPDPNSGSCLNLDLPLEVGDRAQVTPGLSNRIRQDHDLDSEVVGLARPDVTFRIIDGPICQDRFWWWKIRYPGGVVGWTVWGEEYEAWIERVE